MKLWSSFLHTIEGLGAALLLLLAALFFVDVVGRYLVGVTASWIIDLEWYLGAAALTLSFAPTLARDGHVRVDVLWASFRESWKTTLARVGHICLLLPWCVFVVYAASRYAYNSYLIGEGSPDPGGLPLRWAIKSLLPLGFALLGMEGLRQVWMGGPDTSHGA